MKKLFWKKNAAAPVTINNTPSLAACLVMDVLGYATYAVPLFGEFLDILWAPISAMIFFKMFGGTRGLFGGIFNFIEELMPGLDFIPTFTISWGIQYFKNKKGATSFTVPARNYIQKA